MDRPGRYEDGGHSRGDPRYSGEKYELTNNGRHFRTFTQLNETGSRSDVDYSTQLPATSHRDDQRYSPHSQNTQPKDDSEEFSGNLEELDPKTMEFDRLVELMHSKFLSDYLGRILTFLKSNNKEICFPNIAPYKEAFLVKLVTDTNNLYCDSFDGTCRSICRNILKVLDSNRHVYKWIHAYESGIVSKSVLVYQKMFLNKKQDIRDSSLFKVPQSISTDRLSRSNSIIDLDDEVDYGRDNQDNTQADRDEDDVIRPGVELTKRQRNYKALFDSVTHGFIMSALHTIVDFVEDDTRTILQFPDMDSEQARFLKTINSFPFKRGIPGLLGVGCADLVRRLREGAGEGWLRVSEGRARRRDKLRDVTIKKKPPKTRTRDRKKNGQSRSSRGSSRQGRQKAGDYNPRDMFLKALSVSTDSEDSADVADKPDSVKSQESDLNLSNTSKEARSSDDKKRGNNSRYSSTGIDWQPAAEDAEPVAPVADRGRRAVRHSKLSAALAVPVEADKAMRMMKLMGWEGGALGARGEGITEPIMPALDIVSGAGLGHSPTRKKRERRGERSRDTRTSAQFRRRLLEGILSLLRHQDLKDTDVEFQDPLCKKARAFVRVLVEAFNARKNVGLNADEEKDLVCRILTNLNCNTKLALEARMSDDLRLVTISKRTSTQTLTTSRKRRKKSINTVAEPDDSEDETLVSKCPMPGSGDTVTTSDIDNLLKRLGKSKSGSRKSLVALAYRIIFLKKLLNFVSSKQLEQTISFQDILNSRQCKFIENMIVMINKREKAGYSTRTENDLYADIKKRVDCYLKVKFTDNFRKIYLQKKYYTKRFVNTSTSGSGTREERETAESYGCNNNGKDYKNRPGDHEEDDPDEDYEKRIEDMIVLSDSDDSVISLECDYEVLDEDDERRPDKLDKAYKSRKDNVETVDREPKDLTDWNETADMSEVTVAKTVNHVTKNNNIDAAAKVIFIHDPTEISDETLLKRCKNIASDASKTLSNNDKIIENVTDIASEIVLDDNVSCKSIKGDNYNQQILVDDDTHRDNGRNTSHAKDNIHEAIPNEELDIQIKNLDTLKLEPQSPFTITDVRSLSTKKQNNVCNTAALSNGVEQSANGDDLIEISIIVAENFQIKPNTPTNIDDKDTVLINNGEKQDCNVDNAKADNMKAHEMSEKGDYVSDFSPGSSKRSRTESECSETQVPKKPKIQLDEDKKFVAIVPCNPGKEINKEIAAQIQENMLRTLEDSSDQPLLNCNGIIEGKLQYKCHDANSLQWIETFALNLQIDDSKFKLIDSTEDAIRKRDDKIKMAVRINSFLQENAKDVFKRIEQYNTAIKTDHWIVLSEQMFDGYHIFTLLMDYDSYKSIERCSFSLYAAIDSVQFSRIWV